MDGELVTGEAPSYLLGQLRALVGKTTLAMNHEDLPARISRADALYRGEPGNRRPHNDVPVVFHSAGTIPCRGRRSRIEKDRQCSFVLWIVANASV